MTAQNHLDSIDQLMGVGVQKVYQVKPYNSQFPNYIESIFLDINLHN